MRNNLCYLISLLIPAFILLTSCNPSILTESTADDKPAITSTDPGYDPQDPTDMLYKVSLTYKTGSGSIMYIQENNYDKSGKLTRINYKSSTGTILGYEDCTFMTPDNYSLKYFENNKLASTLEASVDSNGNKTIIVTDYYVNGKKQYYSKSVVDSHKNYIYDEWIDYDESELITDYNKYTYELTYNSNNDYTQIIEKEYDQNGSIINQNSDTFSYEYNAYNKKTKMIDQYGYIDFTYYNDGKKKTKTEYNNGSSNIFEKCIYVYDISGNINNFKDYYNYNYDTNNNPLNYSLNEDITNFNINNDITLAKGFEYDFNAKGTITMTDDTVDYSEISYWTVYNYSANGRFSDYIDYDTDGSFLTTCTAAYQFYTKGVIQINNKELIRSILNHKTINSMKMSHNKKSGLRK